MQNVSKVRFAVMETTPSLTDIEGIVVQEGNHAQVRQHYTMRLRLLISSCDIADDVQIYRFDDAERNDGTIVVPLKSASCQRICALVVVLMHKS